MISGMSQHRAPSRHELRSQSARFTGGWVPLELRAEFERKYRERGLSLTDALRDAIATWVHDDHRSTSQQELPV